MQRNGVPQLGSRFLVIQQHGCVYETSVVGLPHESEHLGRFHRCIPSAGVVVAGLAFNPQLVPATGGHVHGAVTDGAAPACRVIAAAPSTKGVFLALEQERIVAPSVWDEPQGDRVPGLEQRNLVREQFRNFLEANLWIEY
uniref:(northern house mosquito) hypothetical protein n=1 Tax=Culex pipiens TaxID=7175 RepID=A0A8D8BX70_CULPI